MINQVENTVEAMTVDEYIGVDADIGIEKPLTEEDILQIINTDKMSEDQDEDSDIEPSIITSVQALQNCTDMISFLEKQTSVIEEDDINMLYALQKKIKKLHISSLSNLV